MAVEITVDNEQERVIRRALTIRRTSRGPLSTREIGVLCGRSETWARAAIRLLGLSTARMRTYRSGGAR